ncbi:bifunctional hydroxymethylpyrimidine kinase/phosphomethylpyrimidine kinase [Deferribacter abyssi]|uniref:bifunctional hydroxymethylpyrimidine kinase/phosphomethylpyrimidine kinase n=1 Tax=Deferribacter abyssi TaxID=213806 RepID=UPI003C15DA2E
MSLSVVLSIAGSDGSSGAGIQADLKTFSALGVYGLTVITAITIQNTQGVKEIFPMPLKMIEKQLDILFADFKIDIVKIGMLAAADIADFVGYYLSKKQVPFILDTIFKASDGTSLFDGSFDNLISNAFMVTPNLDEASTIAGIEIKDVNGMMEGAKRIKEKGAKYALIKGGHLRGEEAVDILFDGSNYEVFTSTKVKTGNTHGTGCTLSSAIAANIAKGMPVVIAVRKAKEFLTESLLRGKNYKLGKGRGPLIHF